MTITVWAVAAGVAFVGIAALFFGSCRLAASADRAMRDCEMALAERRQ